MTLPVYVAAHIADTVRATFWAVEIAFPIPQRITDCDQPVIVGGNVYSPAVLQVEGVRNDPSDTAAISAALVIGSGNDYWQTLLAALVESERNPTVTIYQVWLDPATLSPSPAATWSRLVGRVESADWNTTEARLTIGLVADPAIARLPFREYSEKCCYRKFKGGQCGYVGAVTSCDRTFQACTALGNQARFGGFRYLSPETVELEWYWEITTGDTYSESLTLTRREG